MVCVACVLRVLRACVCYYECVCACLGEDGRPDDIVATKPSDIPGVCIIFLI